MGNADTVTRQGRALRYQVGQQLRRQRRGKGWKQLALAHEVGVSTGTISAWERGTRPLTLDALECLAERLGVDVREFFAPIT